MTVHLAAQVASGVQAHLRSVSVTTVVSNAVTIIAVMTVVATKVGAMTVAVTVVVSSGVNVRGMEVGNAGGMTRMTAGNADAGQDPDRGIEDHIRTGQVQSTHHADHGLDQEDHDREGHDQVLDTGVTTDRANDPATRKDLHEGRCPVCVAQQLRQMKLNEYAAFALLFLRHCFIKPS